ncbi:MAG: TRAP transporter TatT component family protein [bacterium]
MTILKPTPAKGFIVLLFAASFFLNGCFLKSIAVDSIGDSLAGSGDTWSSDNDPELIRQAMPFSLKLIESVLAATPHHTALLTAACEDFTEYAYAFVQQDADFTADKDYPKSEQMDERAKKLYLRAYAYGLRALESRHSSFGRDLFTDPKKAALEADKNDVPALYWTGVAWMAAISLGKDEPALLADLPQAEALVYRAYALDPDYDDGSIECFLITYEGSKPAAMGGSAQKAREHFKRAVELSHGTQLAPYLDLAEGVDEQTQNRAEFIDLLNQALAIDVNQDKPHRLVNLILRKRAKWLLTQVDSLFVK